MKAPFAAALIVAAALFFPARPASRPVCTPPAGSDFARHIERTGTVLAWSVCYLTADFNGDVRLLFAGFDDQDTLPAIGAAVVVSFDPQTDQVFYLYFPDVEPFATPKPAPTPKPRPKPRPRS